jgi:drug/metabolite transporter (DMT)-like permease
VPLIVALMALRVDHEERAEGARLVGLIVGFTGVIVLLGLDVAGRPGELLGALAILVAAVGYAAGPMIIKHRFGDIDPLGPVTASMGISALVLAPAAALSAPSAMPSTQTLLSVLVLGLACSALGFLLFFALIHAVGPGRATVITFVNPVVAVALGIALLDEGLGPSAVAGLLLILAGSWLSTGGRTPPGLTSRVEGRRRRREAAAAAHLG